MKRYERFLIRCGYSADAAHRRGASLRRIAGILAIEIPVCLILGLMIGRFLR